MNAAGRLEDVRSELEVLRDAAWSEAWEARMGRLIAEVDEALVVARSGGCSLCEAGHVPARPCGPLPAPGMGPPDLLNGLQDRSAVRP